MSNIASKLSRIRTVKLDIKEAIEEKGVDMTGVDFEDYADKIDEIEVLDIEEMPYVSFAAEVYLAAGDLNSTFVTQWNNHLNKDIAEIERDGDSENAYGLIEYSDGGLIVPYGTTKIGEYSFFQDTNIARNIVLPSTVRFIKKLAFGQWKNNIKPLIIPDSVEEIEYAAFVNWNNNRQIITIGKGIKKIGGYAFGNGIIPPYTVIKATTPPQLEATSAFNHYQPTFYVPDDSVAAYKAATNWSTYSANIYPISDLS